MVCCVAIIYEHDKNKNKSDMFKLAETTIKPAFKIRIDPYFLLQG
jgi:hypothetical protein